MDNATPDIMEQLVRYLDGELEGGEKKAMDERLIADQDLRSAYENLLETRAAIKYYGLQQKVSSIHQQVMSDKKEPVKMIRPARRIIRYSLAIAASLLLLVTGWVAYSFYSLSAKKVFSQQFHSYELSTRRDDNSSLLTPVERSYQQKKYGEVVNLVAEKDTAGGEEAFLAGMSWMELGNPEKAIAHYTKLINHNQATGTKLLNDEAEYYLALAYIKNKDYDLALALLRSIREDPDHRYHRAITTRLIRKVKMLKWR